MLMSRKVYVDSVDRKRDGGPEDGWLSGAGAPWGGYEGTPTCLGCLDILKVNHLCFQGSNVPCEDFMTALVV